MRALLVVVNVDGLAALATDPLTIGKRERTRTGARTLDTFLIIT